MLIGAAGPFAREHGKLGIPERETDRAGCEGAVAAFRPWGVAGLDAEERLARRPETGSWLVLSGHVHRDLSSNEGGAASRAATTLLSRLEARGAAAVAGIEGSFALAWFDGRSRRLHLLRDRFGVEPLFFGLGPGGTVFGSRTRDLMATGLLATGPCPQGLSEFLTLGFTPGDATLDVQIRRVLPGHCVTVDTKGNVIEIERWAALPAAGNADEEEEAATRDRLRTLLEAAVVRRLDGGRGAVLQSDALASRAVAVLAKRHRDLPVIPFPSGPGDEEQALEIEHAAAEMDVPFCDFSPWLAGRAAAEQADFVLAGEAGSPWMDLRDDSGERLRATYGKLGLPRSVERALYVLCTHLGDSDGPRGLRASLARLVPHPDLPREIGPWRWKCRFTPGELVVLSTTTTRRMLAPSNPFRSLLDGARRTDELAASQLLLLRPFGVEARLPLCDLEVSACAEHLCGAKAAAGESVRAVRDALEDVVPASLPQRTGQPGPSTLLRQWLRSDGPLGRRVETVLGPESTAARGLFRPEAVRHLLTEHRSRRRDHSQRLWALFVLELWLRAREGRDVSAEEHRSRGESSPRAGDRPSATGKG